MSVSAIPEEPTRGEAFRASVLTDLEASDPAAMELLDAAVRTIDELELLETSVREDGVLLDGARGQKVANPSLAAITRHRALLAKILGDLFPATRESTTEAARRAARARWGRA